MTDQVEPLETQVGADPVARPRPTGAPAAPLRGGWVSQALVLVMLLAAGMAVHDLQPHILAGVPGATAWLPLLMVAAGLTGGVLAATRLRAGWVDLIAALVGTVVGLVVVAGVISDAPEMIDRLRDLERSVAMALHDLLVERVEGSEVAPLLLTLSALAWTTGAYAAISVGRHARAMGAIVPIGLMLLIPAILAELRGQDGGQLLWLTIGVPAALLLVLRLNLDRQRVRWLRRQVTGGRSVGRAFLGGGAVLVGIVTTAAVVLTGVMGSAPLQAGWDRVGSVLADWGVDVGGGLRPPSENLGVEFPDSMPIDATWEPRDVTFFTVTTESPGVYWRAKTFDRFDGRRWHVSGGESVDAAADEDLSELTADAQEGDGNGLREVVATITFQDIRRAELVAPQDPAEVDLDTTMQTLETKGGPFQVLKPRQPLAPGGTYDVVAYEPDLDPGSEDGLTAAMLRRAARGASSPDWIGEYLRPPEGGVGRLTRQTAEDIMEDLATRNREDDRYQLALAVQKYLTSSPFRYDVRPERCPRDSTISDCLLQSQEGFCQHYATTMVMLLRELDVPARYVVGFLPGVEEGDQFVVGGGAAHAWVEVWFDGFGWLRFDPTPGAGSDGNALSANGQTQTELLPGNETPPPDLGPDETIDPNETFGPEESFDPDATEEPSPEPSIAPGAVAPGDSGSTGTTLALALVAALVLLAALGLIAFLWFRRLPGGGPDRAWRGITSFATRFGRGPTATQTPYEYSVTLERVVPRGAHDLRAVADAKVAATYGPDHAASGSTAALRAAYARARTGLLALLFRRR